MEEVKRIDFVGAFLMAAGLTLFLLGVSWGECHPESHGCSVLIL